MLIHDANRGIGIVKMYLKPSDIEKSIVRLRNDGASTALENQAISLIKSDFDEECSYDFINAAFLWGRGHRNLGRVNSKNDKRTMSEHLRIAYNHGLNNEISLGVIKVANLKQVRISYSSKCMRFIFPDRAVIMDSVIREKLGFADTQAGYESFLNLCHSILDHVKKSDEFSAGFGQTLRVCDIETAIYTQMQGN
jgi:hypothetical protein